MKNKKKFTIFEAICIFLIASVLSLVLIPNILNIISSASTEVFINEITECYNAAMSKNNTTKSVYTNDENPLKVFADVNYYIVVDSENRVVVFKATSDEFFIDLANSDGIKLSDLQENIIELAEGEIHKISETNNMELYLKTYQDNLYIYLVNANDIHTIRYDIYIVSDTKELIETLYTENNTNNYYVKYLLDEKYKNNLLIVEAYNNEELLLTKEINY